MKHLICLALVLVMSSSIVSAQEKQVITKAEDLPKHSYAIENKDALNIVQNKEALLKIVTMVKSDLLADLQNYDIRENAALREYYGSLSMLNLIEGKYNEALEFIEKARLLADKASGKIMYKIEAEVLISALLKYNEKEVNQIGSHITSSLIEKLSSADFDLIREEVEYNNGSTQITSKNFLLGFVKSEIQPALDNNQGEIPGNLIMELIGMHYVIEYYIPFKEAFGKAYQTILDENTQTVEKVDIWAEREVILKESSKYSPVLIAIWDTGVDTPVLPEKKQWKNSLEKFDGKDTDGNGFIDDVYGISYDLKGFKDANYLEPTAHNMEDKSLFQDNLKGFMDLTANIKSEEANKLRKQLSEISSENVKSFLDNITLYSSYSHGTHVAGIAEEGNDMAKILSARMTFDHKAIPDPPTEEELQRWSALYGETIAYFKKNKVRVVNMSWANDYESTLKGLELNGIGKDDTERKELAKYYFTRVYDAFKKALESAPEILFICAAGNSNDDVDFTADYPASLNLPNLITVGAVDIEGKKAFFTTEGKSVDVYANGYEVESYVPGGDRIAFSGTSMASPNVANLAGKILAVNPKLTPEEVIDIIVKTATKSAEDENVLLIHPKNALNLVSVN